MNLAPIILFVYNRPWHTRKTVESLKKNKLADVSDLIIYSDEAKDDADKKNIQDVRNYLRSVNGFKSVQIIEQQTNKGLVDSIVNGVTKVVNKYGKVIVLEDDIVTSLYFLKYMNDALKYYQNNEKVMHISGYMFPVDSVGLEQTFFLRSPSCWGWATWGRSWNYFEINIDNLSRQFSKKEVNSFNLDGVYNFWRQVVDNKKGIINTWAIFWYASVFIRQGLCLHPAISMTQNIGYDASGTHCGHSSIFNVALDSQPVTFFEPKINESTLALKKLQQFFTRNRLNYSSRFLVSIKRMLRFLPLPPTS